MKFYLLIILNAILIVSSYSQAFSQAKLGLKLSPTLQIGRLDDPNLNATEMIGAGFRPTIGLVADFPIGPQYYFSTGLHYLSKRVKFKSADQVEFEKNYSLQYLQIPLLIKLYTNEIAIDRRLYFQLGGNAEFMIHKKQQDQNMQGITRFLPFDFGLVFGGGIEQFIGVNTSVFVGFSYQRGLLNVARKNNFTSDNLSIKNDLFSLDFGIMF